MLTICHCLAYCPWTQTGLLASVGDIIQLSISQLDSQTSFPPSTSIEAIVNRSSHAVPTEPYADSRLSHITNWTTVTNDTNLLVSLMSAWTEYEYCYYHYLDRESFLDDMASGRNVFCSALLVNALLASACLHSPAITDRDKPFLETSMATRFYKEARQLWDLESGKNSLTKLQAGLCLFLVLGKHGRDKVGHTFLEEACRIGRELGFFGNQPSDACPKPINVPREHWDKVRAVTAWTLFNFQLQMSTTYSSPTIIKDLPHFAIPYDDAPHAEALFRSECAKQIIVLDCIKTMSSVDVSRKQATPRREEVDSCYHRLTAWWHNRDPLIHPDKAPSKENLLCAMMYHVDIINLYQPVVNNEPVDDWTKSDLERARSVTFSSHKAIRRLLALQEQQHGWLHTILFVLHPITVASFGALEEMTLAHEDLVTVAIENSEPYLGLLTCLRALDSLSNYSYYAQPLFRLLTQKCQALNLQLPDAIKGSLDNYTSEEWTRNAALMVSSQYIADMRKTTTNAENARMDAIISGWEGLSLDEAGTRKGKERAV